MKVVLSRFRDDPVPRAARAGHLTSASISVYWRCHQGKEIMELFAKLNREGATIIQVTHNETWAAYGNQIVRLRDGWMEKSSA